MDYSRVVEILRIEQECVSRNNGVNCDRDCANCDLVLDAEEILEAYTIAIGVFNNLASGCYQLLPSPRNYI